MFVERQLAAHIAAETLKSSQDFLRCGPRNGRLVKCDEGGARIGKALGGVPCHRP